MPTDSVVYLHVLVCAVLAPDSLQKCAKRTMHSAIYRLAGHFLSVKLWKMQQITAIWSS